MAGGATVILTGSICGLVLLFGMQITVASKGVDQGMRTGCQITAASKGVDRGMCTGCGITEAFNDVDRGKRPTA